MTIMTKNEMTIPQSLTPSRVTVPSSLRFSQMSLDERMRLCVFMAESTTVPKALQKNPANIYYIAERGDRIGLSATESISCVMVVNGVTSLWGDMQLALCRASDQWDPREFEEWMEVDGIRTTKDFDNEGLGKAFGAAKAIVAYCKAKRRDAPAPIIRSFSIQDAVMQELDQKPGPWRTAPKRMLQMRARSLTLRDGFSDVLFGLYSREEAEDIAPGTITPEQAMEEKSQPATKGAEILKGEKPPLTRNWEAQELADADTLKGARPPAEPSKPGNGEPGPTIPMPEKDPEPEEEEPELPLEPAAIGALVDGAVEQLRKLPTGPARLQALWKHYKMPSEAFNKKARVSTLLIEPDLGFFGVDVEKVIAQLEAVTDKKK